MKTLNMIFAILYDCWIAAMMMVQQGINSFLVSFHGVNPLDLSLMKVPFLLRRDEQTDALEIRASFGEIRAIDGEEGIIEAYLTKWDTVDSYNSTFIRGAFKQTFEERGPGRMRLFFNHTMLCGKILACEERAEGPWVRAQFNLETTAGSDAYAHVRAGDIDCFSFGFLPVKDKRNRAGIREIREVKCFECGPVVFEANEEATIESIRSRFGGRSQVTLLPPDKTIEERAETFDETLQDDLMMGMGWKLLMALEDTLYDIWWSNTDPDEIVTKLDQAISDFQGAYLQWARDYMDRFWEERSEQRSLPLPAANKLQQAMIEHVAGSQDGLEKFAQRSSLSIEDLKLLIRGRILPLGKRERLEDLPAEVAQAHAGERRAHVEELCAEIREMGFTDAEKRRFGALLGIREEEPEVEGESLDERANEVAELFDQVRQDLKGFRQREESGGPEDEGLEDPNAQE